jgi:hypothetical protein
MLIIIVRVVRKLEGEKKPKPKHSNDTGAECNRPIGDTETTGQPETANSGRNRNSQHHKENKK